MENNVLFVNQNHEIIRQFLDVMKENDLTADTADNGQDAIGLLKEREYKVLVTGLDLSPVDGSKLIAYTNHYFPQTVCIVYTWRLEPAHLKLLVNERRVFKIFQHAEGFGGEISGAVMEALEHYDVAHEAMTERQILLQKLKNGQKNLEEWKRAVQEDEAEKEEILRFLEALLRAYAKSIRITLSKRERQILFAYEREIMLLLLGSDAQEPDFAAIERRLYHVCDDEQRKNLAPVIEKINRAVCRG